MDVDPTSYEKRIKELEKENQALKAQYEEQLKKEKNLIGRVL